MTFLMLVQAPVLASPQFQLDASLERRAAAGREQLELLKRDAASSPCWEAALSKLETGCRALDDETQSRLAIAFTNCHLAKSGLPTYACTDAMTVEACTAPMAASTSGLAFSSYTTFFTHAESICFYLQSQAFQASTEAAVDALHSNSRLAAVRLIELREQTGAVQAVAAATLAEQEAAAAAARALLDGQAAARAGLAALSASQVDAFAAAEALQEALQKQQRDSFTELQESADTLKAKQQSLLGGVDALLDLQDALLGEFLDVKAVIFYVSSVVSTVALTSTPRTASARLPIFCALTGNVIVEKMISGFFLTASGSKGAGAAAAHRWLWRARKLVVIIAMLLLARSFLFHTDVGKKAVAMLSELKAMQRQDSQETQRRLAALAAERDAYVEKLAESRAQQLARQMARAEILRAKVRALSPPMKGSPTGRKSKSPPIRTKSPAAASSRRRPSKSPVRSPLGSTGRTAAAAASPPTPPEPPQLAQQSSSVETIDAIVGLSSKAATAALRGRSSVSRRSSNGSPSVASSTTSEPSRRSARIAKQQSIRSPSPITEG